jgi:tRNA pseudouridine synthase 10
MCDRCIGRRLVGALGEAEQKAAAAAWRAEGGSVAVAESDCVLCEGAFARADAWLELALAALQPYEASTIQLGTLFPKELEAAEKERTALVNAARGTAHADSLRTEANRLLMAQITARTGLTTVPEGRPDVTVVVDTRFHTAQVDSTSIFVAGRYRKLRRDLPQTHWPCKLCQGKGCYRCDDAGVMYSSSVEDVAAALLVPLFGGTGASFHGAGREDIDALMLGEGRPFVLEIHGPKRRSAPLELEQDPASGVELLALRMTQKEEVAAIKSGEHDKLYLAHCESASPVSAEQVAAVAARLTGAVLDQRTPERVSHRRADKVRNRTVHEVRVQSFGAYADQALDVGADADDRLGDGPQVPGDGPHVPADGAAGATRFTLRILAESGTYIKELVSGDDGRTQPNVSALLETPVRVAFLDVVGVLDKAPETDAA